MGDSRLLDAAVELLECASLRGDNELPDPQDDGLLNTARMQTAWYELADAVDEAGKEPEEKPPEVVQGDNFTMDPKRDMELAVVFGRWPIETASTGEDSAGRPLKLGDRVRFRGEVYTITAFQPGRGRGGCQGLLFTRPTHVPELPDEISVDWIASSDG